MFPHPLFSPGWDWSVVESIWRFDMKEDHNFSHMREAAKKGFSLSSQFLVNALKLYLNTIRGTHAPLCAQ